MDIYSAKKSVFNYLTKVQKSNLCHYITSFVKKHYQQDLYEILNKFIDNEKHYLEISFSRLPWLEEVIDSEEFMKDLEFYIKANQKHCYYKEKQKPIYEKQKAYAKEQRKFIQEQKMDKQSASKAQMSYYKALCKRHNIETPLNPQESSKLDLKNAIAKILNDTSKNTEESSQNCIDE